MENVRYSFSARFILAGKEVKYDVGDGGVQVENKTGNKLPETGGTGTVLFVVIGAVVVVGAGVLLVTKKRMNMIQ